MLLMASSVPAGADAFNRVGTWFAYHNLPAGAARSTATAAEIIAPARDGHWLLYTDSPSRALGILDITDPAAPQAEARIELGGTPTSVTVAGTRAYVGITTSAGYGRPSGHVTVIDIPSTSIIRSVDLDGQPDAVAISPDSRYLAVAVKNERTKQFRDSDRPHPAAGHLAILDLDDTGLPAPVIRRVSLTGLATIAPAAPEPGCVSISGTDQAVVTLQNNNHVVIVDLPTGRIQYHFEAGSVRLQGVDMKKDRIISLTDHSAPLLREPGAAAWLDDNRFVTANGGGCQGGSRGFTIFTKSGHIEYDSAASLEHLAVSMGHFPEKRAGKKGTEPRTVTTARIAGRSLFFVGSGRGNFVAVYEDKGPGITPVLRQCLPTGVQPAGLVCIPQRGLLAAGCEKDSAKDGVRSTVMLYAWEAASPKFPSLRSASVTTGPIGWGALSGLAADPTNSTVLYAVPDSFFADAKILKIDVSTSPAVIVSATPLRPGGKQAGYDLEGIAVAAGGGFWAVSEGDKHQPDLLLRIAADGTVQQEIALPDTVRSRVGKFGFEGVAASGRAEEEKVYAVFQREWKDDPTGMVPIGVYTPATNSWGFLHYPLDRPESPAGGWVGLSEITSLGGDSFAVIERDNQRGEDARIKRIYAFSVRGLHPAAAGTPPPVVAKHLILDALPLLATGHGIIADKLEGMALTRDGQVFLVTDNDGLNNADGETLFLRAGTTIFKDIRPE